MVLKSPYMRRTSRKPLSVSRRMLKSPPETLLIASLSFIGLGVSEPTPEWGAMLSEAKSQLRYHPYLAVAPGVAIVMTVMSLTLLGDGLRDALDPRLKN